MYLDGFTIEIYYDTRPCERQKYSLNVWRKFLYHFSRKVSLGRDILGDCSAYNRIILKRFVKKYRFTDFIWLTVGRTLIWTINNIRVPQKLVNYWLDDCLLVYHEGPCVMQSICPVPILCRICYKTVLPISVTEPTCLPSGLRRPVSARRLPPQLLCHSCNVVI